MICRRCFAFLALALVPACHHAKPSDPSALVPIEGHGKVLSIDPVLGTGTLDIDGSVVNFWWNNQPRTIYSGGDPEAHPSSPPALGNVGDTIYFRGMQNRGEIYITAAAVAKPGK